MPKVSELITSSNGRLLWLNDTAYVDRLLAGGKTPWGEPAACVAFRRKAAGLLRPDLNVLPIGAFTRWWVQANPELKAAMAARPRAIFPARTLLADSRLRAVLVETVQGLRAAFPQMPLVLTLPSPRGWVIHAYRLAFGESAVVDAGADEADACSVYVAEFLRNFGDAGVDALLLEERPDAEPVSAEEIGWYQPVINVAGHYRWDLGLHLPSADGFAGPLSGVQFVIAPRVLDGAATGLALGEGFWSGDAAPIAPAGGFRFATVPVDGVPEKVLERLAALRGDGG